MRRVAMAGLVVLTAMTAPGCLGRMIGEGVEAAMGPAGKYWEGIPVARYKRQKPLVAYRYFTLGTFSNACGRTLPTDFVGQLQHEFSMELGRVKYLPQDPSGKTLVFNVAVVHYERADLSDNVFGPLEEVVARVDLVDKSSGKVIASGNAVGRTTKSVGLGVQNKAEGLAKALVKWIVDYYPKPPKEKD